MPVQSTTGKTARKSFRILLVAFFLSVYLTVGNTPLTEAIRSKHWDCASFLKKHGGVTSSPNQEVSALVSAAAAGDEATVKALIEKRHDVNETDIDGRSGMFLKAFKCPLSRFHTRVEGTFHGKVGGPFVYTSECRAKKIPFS